MTSVERKTFIECDLTKYFNFNYLVFSAQSIQSINWTYVVVADSGQFSIFFHISLQVYVYKTGTSSVTILDQQTHE